MQMFDVVFKCTDNDGNGDFKKSDTRPVMSI